MSVEYDAREDWIDVVFVRLAEGMWPERYERGWVYLDRIAHLRGVIDEALKMSATDDHARDERVVQQARLLREVAVGILVDDGSELDRLRARVEVENAAPTALDDE